MEYNIPSLEEMKTGSVILIDKPLTWTSFDAINKIKRKAKVKIGHCGTLDPLATGLLICCTGKMTKQITQFQAKEKEYTGIIELGASTPTYDLESEPENFKSLSGLTPEQIVTVVKNNFIGEIDQVPPIHSAIKLNGKRVYEMARVGEEVKLQPRKVTIPTFELTKIELPEVHFRIVCSKGTYIRSIAHDLGKDLGCGGYLKSLRRTKIGTYSVEDALTVEAWVNHIQGEKERMVE